MQTCQTSPLMAEARKYLDTLARASEYMNSSRSPLFHAHIISPSSLLSKKSADGKSMFASFCLSKSATRQIRCARVPFPKNQYGPRHVFASPQEPDPSPLDVCRALRCATETHIKSFYLSVSSLSWRRIFSSKTGRWALLLSLPLASPFLKRRNSFGHDNASIQKGYGNIRYVRRVLRCAI
jgi:hypothetical protein